MFALRGALLWGACAPSLAAVSPTRLTGTRHPHDTVRVTSDTVPVTPHTALATPDTVLVTRNTLHPPGILTRFIGPVTSLRDQVRLNWDNPYCHIACKKTAI